MIDIAEPHNHNPQNSRRGDVMIVYIKHAGELIGPLQPNDVRTLLYAGEVLLTDEACAPQKHSGWRPLYELLPASAPTGSESLAPSPAAPTPPANVPAEVRAIQLPSVPRAPAVPEARGPQQPQPSAERSKTYLSLVITTVKTACTWLLGFGLLAVVGGAVIGGGQLARAVEPWVSTGVACLLFVVLPVSGLLLLSRRSRAYGGLGIYFASFAAGLSLWVTCFAYVVSVSVFWAVIGIVLFGFGIVPTAIIMALVRGEWTDAASALGMVVLILVLRGLGLWIVQKSEEWEQAAGMRAESRSGSMQKRGNYFMRHWRGELPLGVAYWANGILATLLVFGVSSGVAAWETDLRLQSAAIMAVFVLALVVTVWQGVGIWRSASNHFGRGGTHFWAGIAKVMVICSAISTVGLISNNYIPQSAELLRIMTGDPGVPAYKIQVLPGGTEVEFRGGLRAGSANELARILSAVPRAKVLHIESPGGRIAEARQMMRLVRERDLTTYTGEYCMSAATLVLLAGKERVVGAGAKVGFHAGSFPGSTTEQQRDADALLRDTMVEAGVSRAFADHVLKTPSDDMWYPDYGEMRRSGVVTDKSDKFAVSWAQSDSGIDGVLTELDKQPWFRTVRDLEPKVYAKMIDDFTTAIKAGKSEVEAFSAMRNTIAELMAAYLPAASDDALLALLRTEWIGLLSKYRHHNSRACVAVFGGSDTPVNYAEAFPGWDVNGTLAAAEKVMRSGASKTPVRVDHSTATADLRKIFEVLAAKYGRDSELLANAEDWVKHSDKVSEMLLGLYRHISALPQKRAANTMRYIVTQGSSTAVSHQTVKRAEPVAEVQWPRPILNSELSGEDGAVASNPGDGVTAGAAKYDASAATVPATLLKTCRVVKVRPGDVLKVRAGPGSTHPVVVSLRPDARGIVLHEARWENGGTIWQQISVAGHTGWVNEIYIQDE